MTPPAEEAGAASGVLNTGQRVGSAIGIARWAPMLFGTLHVAGPQDVAGGPPAPSWRPGQRGLVLVALALVFGLPRRLRRGWQ